MIGCKAKTVFPKSRFDFFAALIFQAASKIVSESMVKNTGNS
jgi:hypothetical protein